MSLSPTEYALWEGGWKRMLNHLLAEYADNLAKAALMITWLEKYNTVNQMINAHSEQHCSSSSSSSSSGSSSGGSGGSRMLRAGWVMVLTHYLLLLFLLALQAQNVQSAAVPGQGAAEAREGSSPAPQTDSMLIPSWYFKQRDHEIVQKEILPMEEKSSMPGSDEETEALTDTSTPAQHESRSGRSAPGQKAESAGQWQLSMKYILTSMAVSAVLLLAALVGYTVTYQLLKGDVRNQGDERASTECNTFSFGDIND
ncbi:PREDICTED: uncharacterized protein LOC107604265 [Ficedula albicollis]|uniref:uncharacterized protein LOC107604265 n=1 Tax=Ficedula albicollis TaxID=59894 RepID=UPI0007AD8757|nr:PREDICTED: uncharacterized protein LOC107604265 [Ficedula albicollis]